jgi:hypothetical protein
VPVLVWSVAAAICVVVLVDRAQVEYIALDSVSGDDASARASETPVPDPGRPIAGGPNGSFSVLAPAGLVQPEGNATPTGDPAGIWWCRPTETITTSVSPPLLPGDESGGERQTPLTPVAECDPIMASTEPFAAEWRLAAGGKGELRP